jgi:hypothetical protein
MRATRTRSTRGEAQGAACEASSKTIGGESGCRLVVKVVVPLEPVLYKLCKAGWAVIVDRTPNALGTRFVCPF